MLVPIAIQFGQGVVTEPGIYAIHMTATRQKDGESVRAVRDFLVLSP